METNTAAPVKQIGKLDTPIKYDEKFFSNLNQRFKKLYNEHPNKFELPKGYNKNTEPTAINTMSFGDNFHLFFKELLIIMRKPEDELNQLNGLTHIKMSNEGENREKSKDLINFCSNNIRLIKSIFNFTDFYDEIKQIPKVLFEENKQNKTDILEEFWEHFNFLLEKAYNVMLEDKLCKKIDITENKIRIDRFIMTNNSWKTLQAQLLKQ